MTRMLEPCLVRIWGQKRAVGAGTLITDELIVTCAHVVAQALNVSSADSAMPDKTVRLDFPLCAPGQFIQARPIAWILVQPDESGDIAILKIESALPSGAKPAEPVEIDDLWQVPFQTLGFPDEISASAYGRMLALLPGGWVELEPESPQPIAAGFSGAPIFTDFRNSADTLVGIVVAKRSRNGNQIAYMLPIKTIFNTLTQELVQQIRNYHLQQWVYIVYGGDSMVDQDVVFVGREAELARLQVFLNKGLSRELTVCFVNGDPGTGKTALVSEFVRRVQETNTSIVFAAGQCNSQSGIGDPYLPFRQILTLLTGNIDDKRLASGTLTRKNAERLRGMLQVSGQALVEIAPDLIGTLIPGASLIASLGMFAARKAGWTQILEKKAQSDDSQKGDIDQKHIFEQYTALIRKITEKTPLVLILDDLQWADTASIALLFHLSRELRDSQILIIGMYRPSEIEAGRDEQSHPLAKPLTEIRIRDANVWVDLNAVTQANGRAFVEAFIDSEPNLLDKEFRQEVYERTNGYALFTVELLRNLQERGELVKDDSGRWYAPDAIDWGLLPDKVEGVIEERIGRLEQSLRDLLSIASVEGQDFTAQVLAQVEEIKEKDLFRSLSQELTKHHRLIQETGEKRIGQNILFRYAFSHALFHRYLYDALGNSERRTLHGQVAQALEIIYGKRTSEIALQLAEHYEKAGNVDKLVIYFQEAGDKALAIGAAQQGALYFQRIIQAIEEADLNSDMYEQLITAHNFLGESLFRLGKYKDAREEFITAQNLGLKYNSKQALCEATLNIGRTYAMGGNNLQALEHYFTCVEMLHDLDDKKLLCRVELELGTANREMGKQIEATKHYEQALSLAKELNNLVFTSRAINGLSLSEFDQGRLEKSLAYSHEALTIAEQIEDSYRIRTYLANLGDSYAFYGDYDTAHLHLKEALQIAHRIGNPSGIAVTLGYIGRLQITQLEYTEAKISFENALEISRNIGSRRIKWCLMYLSQICLHLGQLPRALDLCSEANQIDDPIYNFRSLAILGVISVRNGNLVNAYTTFKTAYKRVTTSLEDNPKDFSNLYTKALVLAGLSSTTSNLEQKELVEQTQFAYSLAIENFGYKGVLEQELSLLKELDLPSNAHWLPSVIGILTDALKKATEPK